MPCCSTPFCHLIDRFLRFDNTVYHIVWLWTWQALLVFVAFIVIMMLQVFSEEKRLRKDFGEEYEAYCRRTGRFWP
jgi:protein-S-isoprenylcysteine O-methyltransferase Ste14